uniref:(California timema) hypothetical protein n=1 Tax=Timema californicum TaxID=61474 RepID=A0A7R9PE47_TIMCA|nr:unnamed protein product [Timema californicum]
MDCKKCLFRDLRVLLTNRREVCSLIFRRLHPTSSVRKYSTFPRQLRSFITEHPGKDSQDASQVMRISSFVLARLSRPVTDPLLHRDVMEELWIEPGTCGTMARTLTTINVFAILPFIEYQFGL